MFRPWNICSQLPPTPTLARKGEGDKKRLRRIFTETAFFTRGIEQ